MATSDDAQVIELSGESKRVPRISAFLLMSLDDKILAFVPRLRGKEGLDACVTALWEKQRDCDGTIYALYSPQLVTIDGKVKLRTFQGKVWLYAPQFMLNKRNALAAKAEEESVEGMYLPKNTCRGCHDDVPNGKHGSLPPHKFYGDFAKGGCRYPSDLFHQGFDDLDLLLADRVLDPVETEAKDSEA